MKNIKILVLIFVFIIASSVYALCPGSDDYNSYGKFIKGAENVDDILEGLPEIKNIAFNEPDLISQITASVTEMHRTKKSVSIVGAGGLTKGITLPGGAKEGLRYGKLFVQTTGDEHVEILGKTALEFTNNLKKKNIISKTFKVKYFAANYDIIAIKKAGGTTAYYHFSDGGNIAKISDSLLEKMKKYNVFLEL